MASKIKKFKGVLNPIFESSTSLANSDEVGINDEKGAVVVQQIPINRIKPRSDQPRKYFNEEALSELALSIQSKGVIQPIIVRPIERGFFEIIVGERRWRASKQLGLDEIPAVVRDYNKSDCMAVSLIENIQRENLNPLEEAEAIQDLVQECGMTHLQVAESLGKSRVSLTNLLRLLNLETEVKAMLSASLLEMGHARALLSLSGESQIDAAKQVVAKSLTVRETERLVQGTESVTNSVKGRFRLDPSFEEKANLWKRLMSRQLSSKVNVQFGAEGKGKVIIHFDSVEEADWLIDHLEIKKDE